MILSKGKTRKAASQKKSFPENTNLITHAVNIQSHVPVLIKEISGAI
jgi:hypothetical protein